MFITDKYNTFYKFKLHLKILIETIRIRHVYNRIQRLKYRILITYLTSLFIAN